MTIENYKCKSCSAPVAFDIKLQKWRCEHCESVFTKEEIEGPSDASSTRILDQAKAQDENQAGFVDVDFDEYQCPACGAQILAEGNTAATFCIYCQNPSVIKSRFEGKFAPRYLIPFKITQSDAQTLYRGWIRKRIFAPSEFRVEGKIEKIRGLYAPYWLFDCHAAGSFEGEGKITTTRISGEYKIRETRHYYVRREGNCNYEKVPVDGSEKLPDETMFGIEPFDYTHLQPFSTKYMSGYLAEKYDVTSDSAEIVAKERIKKFLLESLQGTGNRYQTLNISNVLINVASKQIDYAMLPIYILTNIYKGKKYQLMINGQTGKIFGETPVSIVRLIIIPIIFLLVMWLLLNTGVAILYAI